MKRIAAFLFASAMIIFSSCSKENQAGKVDMSKLTGTWVESYADDPDFCLDSYIEYTFYDDGFYEFYAEHAMTDVKETTRNAYMINGNVLNLHPEMSYPADDPHAHSYTVIKLDSKRMVWLKVGVEESDAMLSSELKKFVRK